VEKSSLLEQFEQFAVLLEKGNSAHLFCVHKRFSTALKRESAAFAPSLEKLFSRRIVSAFALIH